SRVCIRLPRRRALAHLKPCTRHGCGQLRDFNRASGEAFTFVLRSLVGRLCCNYVFESQVATKTKESPARKRLSDRRLFRDLRNREGVASLTANAALSARVPCLQRWYPDSHFCSEC